MLSDAVSACAEKQKIIVSRDYGSRRRHIAHNKRESRVKQFHLDRDVFPNNSCCDFLVLNTDAQEAYFIEIKGRDIDNAIRQLQSAEALCRGELADYHMRYRIVASRVNTHEIRGVAYRRFKDQHGNDFVCKVNVIEEEI